MPGQWTGTAFGLRFLADFALPGTRAETGPADLMLEWAPHLENRQFRDTETTLWATEFQGRPFRVTLDTGSEHVFDHGTLGACVLSSDRRTLRCWSPDGGHREWQRQLLDTILWCTAFLRGFDLLHASAVAHDGAVLAIVAATGGGKTSTLAELLRRGRTLVADDVVALSTSRADGVIAHPGPPLINLPIAQPTVPRASELGRAIEMFEDEAWVEVPRTTAAPMPLRAVCLLQRGRTDHTSLQRISATVLDLLPFHFGLPSDTARRTQVFETFSDIAERVPIVRLQATASTPPSGIADLLDVVLNDGAPTP